MRRACGLPASVILAALLTGCAAGFGSAAPTPVGTPPTGVDAWLHQQRSDEPDRRAQLRIVNDSGSDLELIGIRIEDGRLAASIEGDAPTLPAGESVDLPVRLPPVACGVGGGDTRLELRFAGGEIQTMVVRDSLGFLARLHERECRAERVADAVTLRWRDFVPSAPGEPASLTLEGRTRSDGVRLRSVQSTPLLQFGEGDLSHPLDIATATGPFEVVVPLVPQRCDPHVVQEDKRGTVFAIDVEVDGERGSIDLATDAATKAALLTWVSQWCDFGG